SAYMPGDGNGLAVGAEKGVPDILVRPAQSKQLLAFLEIPKVNSRVADADPAAYPSSRQQPFASAVETNRRDRRPLVPDGARELLPCGRIENAEAIASPHSQSQPIASERKPYHQPGKVGESMQDLPGGGLPNQHLARPI